MNRIPGLEQCAHALLCALVFALTSCGGSDDVAPPANQVGPAGGTVTGPNGTQVVVPAGALSAPVAITFMASAAQPLPAGLQPLGVIYDLGPAGTTFAVPVTVTLPLDPAQVPAGARIRMLHELHVAGTDTWEELPGLVVGATSASARTTSFSHFTLALGNSPPVVTAQPVAQAVMAPMGASFSVSFTGTPPFDVQWERSNDGGTMWANAAASQNVIASPGTSTLTLASTSALAAATGGDNGALFRAAIRNIETPVLVPVLSSVVTLTVTAVVVPPTITIQPQSVSGAIGNASFSVVATGTNLVYQWFKNGAPILGATNASLNLVNVQAGDAGSYTVVVSNLVNGAPINSVTSNVATLTTPPPATSVARIAAGNNTSSAVTASGVLYTWGTYRGAGAPNTSGSTAAPIALAGVRTVARGSSTHGVAVRTDATVWAWGYAGDVFCNFGGIIYDTPTQVPGAANIASASAGTGHTLLLSNTGVVSAFGCNGSGQLGQSGSIQSAATAVQVPGLPAGITAVAAGNYFSLALDGNGNVWAWGKFTNFNGTTLIDYGFTPVQIAGLTGIKAIAAGDSHALALKNDGSVSAWGSNSNGKLGDGTEANRLTPVATLLTSGIKAVDASNEFSLALREIDGVVLSWGINETGQLGSGSNSPGFRVTPAPVVGLSQVEAIAAGKTFSGGLGHSLALRMDGTVWAWGWNMAGQLGNGNTNNSTTPVQVTGLNLN